MSHGFPEEKNRQDVVAVVLRNWPPQFLVDKKTKEPAGFAIDVMNKVAELSRLNVRYVICNNWSDAFEILEKNQAVLSPNMGITDERLSRYDFTVPYETFRISIFVRNSSNTIDGLDDLEGVKVGVVKANQGRAVMEKHGQSDLQRFDSMEEAFMALISGQIEALVYPEQTIMEMARRAGLETKIKRVGKPLQEIKRGIAVRKGEPELFQRLDKAVQQFIKTRDYQLIYEKWHGKPKPFWTVNRLVMVMGTVLGMVIAGLVGWRYLSILKLNKSLFEAEERFREIVENTSAGYFFIDKEGRFKDVNQAWLTMHGYDSPEDVIGQSFTLTQAKTDLETARQILAMLLSGQSIPTDQLTRCCKDGSVGYHTFSAHPVLKDGQVIGVEGFIIDTTKHKQAENEKETLETKLWQLRKAESLSRMAGAIAHHFNNQFSVIMGNLELALDGLPGNTQTCEFLTQAMKATRRSSEISGLMLTYLGQGAGKRESIDLSETCRQNIPLLEDIIKKEIILETDFLSPGPCVAGDANQIRRVLTHLVANSSESIEGVDGKITLAVKMISTPQIPQRHVVPVDWKPDEDRYACIEVTDTGHGIPDQDMNKLFDPFFTSRFVGRGLGLAVVLGIIKAYKGAIGVQSRVGHGSTFRIFLPVVQAQAFQQPEKTAGVKKKKQGSIVLLVEDQDQIRQIAATRLENLGFSVIAAADGTQALNLFRQRQDEISCVITDLTMPGMDGWELISGLRRIQTDLPIILVSGYEEVQAMNHEGSEKPHAFLHKPYTQDELKKVLCSVLQIKI
ncbi:MAG: transporter substrate-binding domain-containing protein [Pseudomonadota bacterium]